MVWGVVGRRACRPGRPEGLTRRLQHWLVRALPESQEEQYDFFRPDLDMLSTKDANFHRNCASNLMRTLVDRNGFTPMGLLRTCLEYARQGPPVVGGIFAAVRKELADLAQGDLLEAVSRVYAFRNKYVAHQEEPLTDPDTAKDALAQWARALHRIWSSE